MRVEEQFRRALETKDEYLVTEIMDYLRLERGYSFLKCFEIANKIVGIDKKEFEHLLDQVNYFKQESA